MLREGFIRTGRGSILVSFILAGVLMLAGCTSDTKGIGNKGKENNSMEQKKQETISESATDNGVNRKPLSISIDSSVSYQTIESFGASGAWWSQDVGGWTEKDENGVEIREKIATLLFDKEQGIGLSCYRYNIGAGSADIDEGTGENSVGAEGITDTWRRACSFETAPNVYDWERDKNAVWFMEAAREKGVLEIVMFANSPLERLTKNGKAYGEEGDTSNLSEDKYKEFADYVLDVAEHFKEEGYPVKYISPINEPQWEWTGGQEGCHYEPEEMTAFYHVFLDEMEARNITDMELSAPELGEWGNTSYPYYKAILGDERLANALTGLDVHSYWSDLNAKLEFKRWLSDNTDRSYTLRMSEWCEMKNGMDFSMDSALNLAEEVMTDLTRLNVASWQYWIAVSCYNYRDGLIFVDQYGHTMKETKRLWALGNFSRFIRPEYVRVDCVCETAGVSAAAFLGKNGEEQENMVVVIVNPKENEYEINKSDLKEWSVGEVYVTDEQHSLEKTEDISSGLDRITIPKQSVVTLNLTVHGADGE